MMYLVTVLIPGLILVDFQHVKENKMKINVDGKECFSLTETQKKVIKNDIHADVFEEDMKRRLHYILTHKYERCFERLKSEWIPLLQSRVDSIPTDPDALAELIFNQPDYKDRKSRESKVQKMPLIKSKSKKSIGENISTEEATGKSKRQAIAIALNVARKAGAAIPKKKNK